jgi:hypothetical protein
MKHNYTKNQIDRAKALLLAQFMEDIEKKHRNGESSAFLTFALARFFGDLDALAVRVLDETKSAGGIIPSYVPSDSALIDRVRERYPESGEQVGIAGEVRVSIRRILVEDDGEHLSAGCGSILCTPRIDHDRPTRSEQVCAVAAALVKVASDALPMPPNGKVAFHCGDRQSRISSEIDIDEAINMSEFLLGFPPTK